MMCGCAMGDDVPCGCIPSLNMGFCQTPSGVKQFSGHSLQVSRLSFLKEALEEVHDILLIVEGLYPNIVNAVDEVTWLMGDLTAHGHDSPALLLPHFVRRIIGDLAFDWRRGNDEINLGLIS